MHLAILGIFLLWGIEIQSPWHSYSSFVGDILFQAEQPVCSPVWLFLLESVPKQSWSLKEGAGWLKVSKEETDAQQIKYIDKPEERFAGVSVQHCHQYWVSGWYFKATSRLRTWKYGTPDSQPSEHGRWWMLISNISHQGEYWFHFSHYTSHSTKLQSNVSCVSHTGLWGLAVCSLSYGDLYDWHSLNHDRKGWYRAIHIIISSTRQWDSWRSSKVWVEWHLLSPVDECSDLLYS